jgi:hypothetical protein
LEELPVSEVHAENALQLLDLAVGQDSAADVLRGDGGAVRFDAAGRKTVDGANDVANLFDAFSREWLQTKFRIKLDFGSI